MPPGDPHRYAAFVSYRHVEPDRRWAIWLHRALERYRVPAATRRELSLPRRVGRAFRDEEELAACPKLSAEIEKGLAESRFLIVICSPRTPASHWVNSEILRFREMGRGDRILALLIEGEPKTAFPLALREIRTVANPDPTTGGRVEEVEPLAADVRLSGLLSHGEARRTALLRLVSTMLGCRFDDLRQRDRLFRRKQIAVAATILAILVLAIALSAYLRAKHRRPLAEVRRELDASNPDNRRYEPALAEMLQLEPRFRGDSEFEDLYARALAEGAPSLTEELFRRIGPRPADSIPPTLLGRIGAAAEDHLSGARQLPDRVRSELLVQLMLSGLLQGKYQLVLDSAVRFRRDLADQRIDMLQAVALARTHRAQEAEQFLRRVLASSPKNMPLGELCCRAFLTLELLASDVRPEERELVALGDELRERYSDDVAQIRARKNFLGWMLALIEIEIGRYGSAASVLSDRLRDPDAGPVEDERPPMSERLAVAIFGDAVTQPTVALERVDEAADILREATAKWHPALSRAAWEMTLLIDRRARRTDRGRACAARLFEKLFGGAVPPEAFDEKVCQLASPAIYDWTNRRNWEGFVKLLQVIQSSPAPTTGELSPWERNLWIVALGIADRREMDRLLPRGLDAVARARAAFSLIQKRLPKPHVEFEVMVCATEVRKTADGAATLRLKESLARLQARIDAVPDQPGPPRDLREVLNFVLADGKALEAGLEHEPETRKD